MQRWQCQPTFRRSSEQCSFFHGARWLQSSIPLSHSHSNWTRVENLQAGRPPEREDQANAVAFHSSPPPQRSSPTSCRGQSCILLSSPSAATPLCNTAQKSPPPQTNEWTWLAQGHGLLTRSRRISAQAPWPQSGLYRGILTLTPTLGVPHALLPAAGTPSPQPPAPPTSSFQTGAHCVPRIARCWACKVRARPHFEVRITTWGDRGSVYVQQALDA